jgi:RNA polymerase sigma factor (sigma-70 family)
MPDRKTTYSLDAEAQARVVGCLGLAYKLAHRFAFSRGLDPDEAKGVAVESLCRAAACFDPTRGIKFTAYAGKAVMRALVVLTTQEHRRRRVRGLSFSDMRGEEDIPFDPADGRTVLVERLSHDADLLDKLKKRLPARLWYVLRSRFREGLTLGQIGASLGITRQAVFLRLQDALRSARLIADE